MFHNILKTIVELRVQSLLISLHFPYFGVGKKKNMYIIGLFSKTFQEISTDFFFPDARLRSLSSAPTPRPSEDPEGQEKINRLRRNEYGLWLDRLFEW